MPYRPSAEATATAIAMESIRRGPATYKTPMHDGAGALTLNPHAPPPPHRVVPCFAFGRARRCGRGHAAAPARPLTSCRHATLPDAFAIVRYVFARKQS